MTNTTEYDMTNMHEYDYYWLEFLNAEGEWEIENGYMTRAEAVADKENLIGSYAPWTPRQWLRNKDVRVRKERVVGDADGRMIMTSP